jgi:hypothetical protein
MLDLNQINLLPNDAKIKYLALEKLFDHPSFKYLVEWAKAQVEDCKNRVLNATTWEAHVHAIGAGQAYQNFANIEDFTEREFAAIAEEAEAAKIDEESDQANVDNE